MQGRVQEGHPERGQAGEAEPIAVLEGLVGGEGEGAGAVTITKLREATALAIFARSEHARRAAAG